MSEQLDFLAEVVDRLNAAGVQSMVCGSYASSFHGRARTTNDIDIVIDGDADAVSRFVNLVTDADWYVSPDAAAEAMRTRSMFNVVDPGTGAKADLIFRKDRPFSLREFERRRPVRLLGNDQTIATATAEDTILAKLEWSGMQHSDRQVEDAVGIARAVGDRLDLAYLRKWASELDVAESLEQVLAAAELT